MTDRFAMPLPLRPRLDPKPWGGTRLAHLAAQSGDEPIGEALVTGGEAVVADGPLAGETLATLAASDAARLVGSRGLVATGQRAVFPLLVKLIDARDDLSIQVHPPDVAGPDGRLGKTEAWHVLDADPGARIAVGLRPGVAAATFAAACRAGRRTADLLRWLPAVPGTTLLIPAGTVHAMGAGCLVYEVQQPSNVTYRLDDWGRRGAAGRARPLHLDQGLAVLDAAARPEPIAPVVLAAGPIRRDLLAACRWFALERIGLPAGARTPIGAADSPHVLTCLDGQARLETEAGAVVLTEWQSAAIAAGITGAIAADTATTLLRAWVPNLPADVVAPARAVGHADAATTALAGPLPDIVEAMRNDDATAVLGSGGAGRDGAGGSTRSPRRPRQE